MSGGGGSGSYPISRRDLAKGVGALTLGGAALTAEEIREFLSGGDDGSDSTSSPGAANNATKTPEPDYGAADKGGNNAENNKGDVIQEDNDEFVGDGSCINVEGDCTVGSEPSTDNRTPTETVDNVQTPSDSSTTPTETEYGDEVQTFTYDGNKAIDDGEFGSYEALLDEYDDNAALEEMLTEDYTEGDVFVAENNRVYAGGGQASVKVDGVWEDVKDGEVDGQ